MPFTLRLRGNLLWCNNHHMFWEVENHARRCGRLGLGGHQVGMSGYPDPVTVREPLSTVFREIDSCPMKATGSRCRGTPTRWPSRSS